MWATSAAYGNRSNDQKKGRSPLSESIHFENSTPKTMQQNWSYLDEMLNDDRGFAVDLGPLAFHSGFDVCQRPTGRATGDGSSVFGRIFGERLIPSSVAQLLQLLVTQVRGCL